MAENQKDSREHGNSPGQQQNQYSQHNQGNTGKDHNSSSTNSSNNEDSHDDSEQNQFSSSKPETGHKTFAGIAESKQDHTPNSEPDDESPVDDSTLLK